MIGAEFIKKYKKPIIATVGLIAASI